MQLEFPYLMNVVLYVNEEECIKQLPFINKQMVSIMEDIKINPLIEESDPSFIFKYFPNINTYQVTSLLEVLPKKYLDKLSFIKVSEKLYLYQWNSDGSDWELVAMQEDGSSTFFTDKHYVYNLSENYSPLLINSRINDNDNYSNEDNINIGDMLYWKHDLSYIERLENMNIHSLESQTLFLKHYKDFKGLKTLRIVIENECENEFFSEGDNEDGNVIDNNDEGNKKMDDKPTEYVEVLKNLQFSKTLKKVELISVNAEIAPILKETIKNNSHIQFVISFYEYNNDYYSEYIELERYSNVHLQFIQLDDQFIQHNFILSSYYPFVKTSTYGDYVTYLEYNINCLSKHVNEYNKIFDAMQYRPNIEIYDTKRMEDIHDLNIEKLYIYRYTDVKLTEFLPLTLNVLKLGSFNFSNNHLDLSTFKLIKLDLDNCNLFEITLPTTLKKLYINFSEKFKISCSKPIELKKFNIRYSKHYEITINGTTGSQHYIDENTQIIKNITKYEIYEISFIKPIISDISSLILSAVHSNSLTLQKNNNTIFSINKCLNPFNVVYNEKGSYFSLVDVNLNVSLSKIQVKTVKLVKCKISLLDLSDNVEVLKLEQCKFFDDSKANLNHLKQLILKDTMKGDLQLSPTTILTEK
ncbi:Uncharacterized protein QTN25_010556 [Entamoeba marina]